MVHRGCVAACAPPPPQLVAAPIKAPLAQAPVMEQGRMVKLNLTVDPSREDSRPVMTQGELESAYRVYIKVMGAPPAPHEEATQEQLSAVRALLKDDLAPYVDMCLWTPFNLRLQRKMATTGLKLAEDGTFRKSDQRAPPDYESWRQAFKVLKTVLISLEAVSPARLERYADKIHRFARLYGPDFWGAVYAADVKMRQEHFERLRRRGAAIGAGGVGLATEDLPTWDPTYPWEWVFAAAVHDQTFWHDELDAPVLLATSQGCGSVGNMSIEHPIRERAPPQAAKRKRQQSKPHSSDRHHQVDEQGNFELNRRGNPICRAYNKGECSGGTGP
eukprot:918639-Amphidinium_carterae.1